MTFKPEPLVELPKKPELKELEQLVRDQIAPTKDLGHSERSRNVQGKWSRRD